MKLSIPCLYSEMKSKALQLTQIIRHSTYIRRTGQLVIYQLTGLKHPCLDIAIIIYGHFQLLFDTTCKEFIENIYLLETQQDKNNHKTSKQTK